MAVFDWRPQIRLSLGSTEAHARQVPCYTLRIRLRYTNNFNLKRRTRQHISVNRLFHLHLLRRFCRKHRFSSSAHSESLESCNRTKGGGTYCGFCGPRAGHMDRIILLIRVRARASQHKTGCQPSRSSMIHYYTNIRPATRSTCTWRWLRTFCPQKS